MNFTCWRLPNTNKIEWIEENAHHNQEFVIQKFDKNIEQTRIFGSISEINFENLKAKFENIFLKKSDEISISTSKKEFLEMFDKAKKILTEKEIEKIVISRFEIIKKEIDLYQTFCKLCLKYPTAFVFFFIIQTGQAMIGASPEIILKSNSQNQWQTEALGGTETKNGFTEKEYLEHEVIVHHIDNVLSKNVTMFHKNETFKIDAGPVKHLKTCFDITNKEHITPQFLVKQLHPTPAISGYPVEKSLDKINEIENNKREFYLGYLGPKYSENNFYWAVNLRSAEVYKNEIKVFAGVGLNLMSNFEDEWTETENKLSTMMSCL